MKREPGRQGPAGPRPSRVSTDRAAPGGPCRPGPPPPDLPRRSFARGRDFPGPIAWFGARSLWGHLWHFAASAIATEDIDSRAWMIADEPEELVRLAAIELGGDPFAPTLTEALGEDLWVDFVADTGDDVSVSRAVAEMLFGEYAATEPESGEEVSLPRGHVLLFGGDTAYPVATELEIHNRVIVPWNRVLRDAFDGRSRVLLGVPGNHDWYAGLDGFGRMFRRRRGEVDRASRVPGAPVPTPEGEEPAGEERIDRAGNIGHFVAWMEAFRVGRFVAKRSVLPLIGYAPIQSASYFALPLAPNLLLLGPDRQLRDVDVAQRAYFAEAREGGGRKGAPGLVVCMADPASAFLEPSAYGQRILEGLDLEMDRDGLLVLSGDTHHYCRERFGRGLHVTAGGGGAFLHPARISRRGARQPEAEFPGPRASLSLALRIPLQIAHGRSGFLVHLAVLVLLLPTYGASFFTTSQALHPVAGLLTAALAAAACFLIGGVRNPRWRSVLALAALVGAFAGLLPLGVEAAFDALRAAFSLELSPRYAQVLGYALCVYAGTLAFGAFLTALTVFGIEQHQAFAALAHPGYKHFVRLRVRKDGSAVDAWVLGKVDPLAEDEPVVLVDSFTWRAPGAAAEGGREENREAPRVPKEADPD